ncbi:MAG: CidA/LrgA family protein [Anaerovoracaceae bacterium]
MKIVKQFGIILAISFLAELIKSFVDLPIPASIYGLVIMLLALKFRVIKLGNVKDVGNFLIEIMPVMFIPAAVGLMASWSLIRHIWFPVIVVTLLTTIIVMVATGIVTQAILNVGKEKNNERNIS